MNEEGLLLELVPEQEESSLRRQVLTEVYAFNGALYVLEVDFFKKSKTFRPYQETYGYKMPTEEILGNRY